MFLKMFESFSLSPTVFWNFFNLLIYIVSFLHFTRQL